MKDAADMARLGASACETFKLIQQMTVAEPDSKGYSPG